MYNNFITFHNPKFLSMKFNIALVVSMGLSASLFAQTPVVDAPPASTETKRTGETLFGGVEALKKYEAGETRFPPRPRDMWELGVHGGHLFYAGDINAQPGYGFGVHVRKSLGYVLSARLDLMLGEARGVNYKPYASYNVPVTTGGANITVREYNQISQNPVLNSLKDSKGVTLLESVRDNGNQFFPKYRSEFWQASLDGIVNIGNLLFHKQNNKWNVYGLTGVGVYGYRTYYDVYKGSARTGGDFYDYKAIADRDLNTFAGRDARLQDILKAGSTDIAEYETPAEKRTSTVDIFERGSNIDKYTANIYIPVGVGVSYRLSRRVNVTLEHKVMFADDDLLDGQQWAAQRGFTPNRDNPHYSSVRLAFNLGKFSKAEEPLYWQNPMDQPLAGMQEVRKGKDDMLKDDDNDGVINMLDKEEKTPEGAPVDTRGRALDSDADGVPDYRDDEPHTAPKSVVNDRGIGAVKPIDCSACGSNWFLPSVHFDDNSYCIKGDYYSDLKNVANVLSKNPKTCIAVTGFTDEARSDDYNQGLSYNRAKAVADFLSTNYGVDRSRIIVKIGGQDNIAKSASSSNFANRRVEIETVACGTQGASAPASAASSGTSVCAPTVINYPPPPPYQGGNYKETESVKTSTGIRVKGGMIKR
jgi:OmpA-OmpF porin, OOP family